MSRPVTLFTGQWADLPLSELAASCAHHGKICLFVSCSSRKYVHGSSNVGLARDIHFEDIGDILDDVTAALRESGRNLSLADLERTIRQGERKIEVRFWLTHVGGAFLAGGVVIYAVGES